MKVLVVFILLWPFVSSAVSHDSCRNMATNISTLKQIATALNAKIQKVESLKETDGREFQQGDSSHVFGQFYKVQVRNHSRVQNVGLWMMPYAQGKACVLRDIKNL